MTDDTASATSAAAQPGKSSKSSDFKFPASKPKANTASKKAAVSSTNRQKASSPALNGTATAVSLDDSNEPTMAAVSTSRSEAVKMSTVAVNEAESSPEGLMQPQYEIVYRGQVDLADGWEGPAAAIVSSAKHPKVGSSHLHILEAESSRRIFFCSMSHLR